MIKRKNSTFLVSILTVLIGAILIGCILFLSACKGQYDVETCVFSKGNIHMQRIKRQSAFRVCKVRSQNENTYQKFSIGFRTFHKPARPKNNKNPVHGKFSDPYVRRRIRFDRKWDNDKSVSGICRNHGMRSGRFQLLCNQTAGD